MSGWNPLRESLGPDEGLCGLREFYVSWYVCLTGDSDREFVCLAHRSEIIAKFLGSINPNSNHVTVTKPDSKGEVPTDGPLIIEQEAGSPIVADIRQYRTELSGNATLEIFCVMKCRVEDGREH